MADYKKYFSKGLLLFKLDIFQCNLDFTSELSNTILHQTNKLICITSSNAKDKKLLHSEEKNIPMEDLLGKVVIVSGGRGGVGLEIINYLTSKNATCISIDKVKPKIRNPEIQNLFYLNADLSNIVSVKNVVQNIIEITGRVDLLINAAGIFIDDQECIGNEGNILELWKNNYMTAYILTTELFSLLSKSTNALVVNISSADSIVASAGQNCEIGTSHDIIYASTKGAINTLTKCLAMKWARNNIRVNAICPTIIRTPMCETLLAKKTKEKELTSYIPLSRICEPLDIAVAIEMLYNMKMTTGHLLTIDGGYLCQ